MPRWPILIVSIWAAIAAAFSHGPGADAVDEKFILPLSFRLREMLGRTPAWNDRLKIFAFDDRTYAALRRSQLTGAEWARLLGNLGAASPAAIVTTHMLGADELDEAAFAGIVAGLKMRGTQVVAAAYAPGRRLAPALALGHVDYDGAARIHASQDLGDGIPLPHLALAAATYAMPRLARVPVGPAGPTRRPHPAADAAGRVLLNLLPEPAYAARIQALSQLLADDGAAVAERLITPGDTVLLLTDAPASRVGRAGFVQAPLGPVPGGYVVAALLSGVLSDRWITPRDGAGILATLLLGLCGTLVGQLASGRGLAAATGVLTIGVPAAGLAAFVYGATLVPWLPGWLAFVGPAVSLYGLRLRRRHRQERQDQLRREQESVKLGAVVRTSQMFAHDVRKPFSLLRAAVEASKRQPTAAAATAYLHSVLPELERAMGHVEEMIRDVMEIDAAAAIVPEPTPLAELIAEALHQVTAPTPTLGLPISYRFDHTLPVAVDRGKVRRVFTNLFDNAVQALEASGRRHTGGRLWITARDVIQDGRAFVEVVIGNSDSYVPPEKRERIFEAFHTGGKAGGTGLGLAIARKVIAMHGGQIRCESSRQRGTEFVMTLPIAQATPCPAAGLGLWSVELQAPPAAAAAAAVAPPRLATIAVLDDDPFFLDAWRLTVDDARVLTFANPAAFWQRLDDEPGLLGEIDVVVTDLYFNDARPGGEDDGLELARGLKRRTGIPVCLCTDAVGVTLPNAVDAQIAKLPVSFAALVRQLPGRRAG